MLGRKKNRYIGAIIIGSALIALPICAKESVPLAINITNVQQTHTTLDKVLEVIQQAEKEQTIEYLVIDVGYCQGNRINKYLATGSKDILDEIMNKMYDPHRTEEMKVFLQKLYTYKHKVKSPIQIIGTGADRKEDTVEAMTKLLEPYIQHSFIKQKVELLQMYPSIDVAQDMQTDLELSTNDYQNYLPVKIQEEMKKILDSMMLNKPRSYISDRIEARIAKEEGEKDRVYIEASSSKEEYTYEVPVIYQNSHTINWDTMETVSIKESIPPLNQKYIKIIEDKAAQVYGYDAMTAHNYIQQNTKTIDTQQTKQDSQLITKEDLNQNRLFMAGEYHGNSGNYEMQLFLIQYLNQQAGVKLVGIECGYATGLQIDRYIQTGESELLEVIMKELSGTAFDNNEYKLFLQNLRKYNASLPAKSKLKIRGIDLTTNTATIKKELKNILKNCNHTETKTFVEELDTDKYQSKRQVLEKLDTLLGQHKKAYTQELGTEAVLHLEMMNHLGGLDVGILGNHFLGRERVLIEGMEKLLGYYRDEKMFLQIGAFHATTTYSMLEGDSYTLAEYSDKHSRILQGQVLSIIYAYYDSQMLQRDKVEAIPNIYPPIFEDEDKYTILKTGKYTPLQDMYINAFNAPIKDSFDYIITMNRVGANTPIIK